MAKEECITQCNIARDTSKLRNRKSCPTSEKIQTFQNPSKNTQHSSEDDSQSSNGTSAHRSNRGRTSNTSEEPSCRLLLLMVVMGLSFSTRLYKITEPPHVWWVNVFCMYVCGFCPSYCIICHTRALLGVSAGMRHTLGRWEAITSTGPSFLMSILLLEK